MHGHITHKGNTNSDLTLIDTLNQLALPFQIQFQKQTLGHLAHLSIISSNLTQSKLAYYIRGEVLYHFSHKTSQVSSMHGLINKINTSPTHEGYADKVSCLQTIIKKGPCMV